MHESNEVLGPNHFYVAMTLDSIANLKDRLGQVEEALAVACRSLAIWERFFGPQHPHIAKILFNLAGRRDSLGEVDESLRLYARALEIQEHLDPDSTEVADILNATANLRERMGEIADCLNLYSRRSIADGRHNLLVELGIGQFRHTSSQQQGRPEYLIQELAMTRISD